MGQQVFMPLRLVFWGALLALLAGCAQSPRQQAVPVNLPATWGASTPRGNWPEPRWWTGFQAAELDRLIEQALAGSPDVRIAEQRVRSAELTVQQAGASLFPSLGLSASGGARRPRARRPATRGAWARPPAGNPRVGPARSPKACWPPRARPPPSDGPAPRTP